MKNINLIIVLLIGLICGSCKDFLEEEPLDELSVEENFSEPSHAFIAVNSLYRNGVPQMFDGGVYSGTPAMLGPYMSGFFDNEYKGQEVHVQHAQQLTLDGNNMNSYLGSVWDNMYVAISRANNAILNIPTTPGLTETEANQLLGEARFFRAYAYYYLVRMFGPVPIVTQPYTSLDSLYVPRSTIKEVYTLIEEDLLFAVNQGELADGVSMADNGGRVTKGAAATLLAEVYLTMSGFPLQEDNYADAAAMAENVIGSGTYSLTQHSTGEGGEVIMENSAYNKIRRSDAVANEYIFYHEYAGGISDSPYPPWSYPTAEAAEAIAYSLTNGAYQPVEEFLWGYDSENDLRAQDKQYYHHSIVVDGDLVTFEPTPYMWHDDAALFGSATSGKDKLVYSYSDVLLIAAESIALSEGVTAKAVEYLAQVRSRAYWKQDMSAIEAELMGLPVNEFVEEVWEERYRELVFEFPLWFDMIRTRKYPETAENANGEITFVELVGHTNNWGKTFEAAHLLFPLPNDELQRNPSLGEQNPGY